MLKQSASTLLRHRRARIGPGSSRRSRIHGEGGALQFSRLIKHNSSFNRPATASAVRRVGLSLTLERGALSTGRALRRVVLHKQLIPPKR